MITQGIYVTRSYRIKISKSLKIAIPVNWTASAPLALASAVLYFQGFFFVSKQKKKNIAKETTKKVFNNSNKSI